MRARALCAKARDGFTLVELVVALFITAIMFAIGYRALDQALTSRQELDEHTARMTAVQQAVRTLEQDFELLQPRPVRNLIGDGYMPAVMSGQSSTGLGASLSNLSLNGNVPPIITFTRGGWTNPVGIPRSELQRVSYSLQNGALIRSYYAVLDATSADVPVARTLIDHVKSFSLRFMDAGHNWQTAWPPTVLGGGQQNVQLRVRPVAVEVTLELEDWGVIVRHIEVAG